MASETCCARRRRARHRARLPSELGVSTAQHAAAVARIIGRLPERPRGSAGQANSPCHPHVGRHARMMDTGEHDALVGMLWGGAGLAKSHFCPALRCMLLRRSSTGTDTAGLLINEGEPLLSKMSTEGNLPARIYTRKSIDLSETLSTYVEVFVLSEYLHTHF